MCMRISSPRFGPGPWVALLSLAPVGGCSTEVSLLPCEVRSWFEDADADGHGGATEGVRTCDAPPGYVDSHDDCDDGDAAVAPGAAEICDGRDNDCDTLVDDLDPGVIGGSIWYADADDDGAGDPAASITACGLPDGYSETNDDCAPADPGIHPGAPDSCDGVDQDCDGLDACTGCEEITDGLLARWAGDGDATDSWGTHDAAPQGSVTYVPGIYGDAFQFDGLSGVTVAHDAALDFSDGIPFTYALWVHRESARLPMHVLGRRGVCAAGNTFDYQLVLIDGPAGIGVDGWGYYNCSAIGDAAPALDTWEALVVTFDGDGWTIHQGGVEHGTEACGAEALPVLGNPLWIGRSGECGDGWVGAIDEVKLWNRVLTPAEIGCMSDPTFVLPF